MSSVSLCKPFFLTYGVWRANAIPTPEVRDLACRYMAEVDLILNTQDMCLKFCEEMFLHRFSHGVKGFKSLGRSPS
jgi:hypothetical protein